MFTSQNRLLKTTEIGRLDFSLSTVMFTSTSIGEQTDIVIFFSFNLYIFSTEKKKNVFESHVHTHTFTIHIYTTAACRGKRDKKKKLIHKKIKIKTSLYTIRKHACQE